MAGRRVAIEVFHWFEIYTSILFALIATGTRGIKNVQIVVLMQTGMR
jgi:hypothetical protein